MKKWKRYKLILSLRKKTILPFLPFQVSRMFRETLKLENSQSKRYRGKGFTAFKSSFINDFLYNNYLII